MAQVIDPMFDHYYFRSNTQFETKFHRHTAFEINYFYDSGCKLMVGNRCIEATAGCLLIMDGLTMHGPIMQKPCVHTMLRFDVANIRPFFMMNTDVDLLKPFPDMRNHYWQLAGREKAEVEDILQRMERFHNQSDPIKAYRMRTVFLELLLFIFEHYRETYRRHADFPTNKEMKAKSIMRYIEEHFMCDLSLDILSKEVCLSKFYLSRLFKETTGLTIFEYVNRQRIIQAKLMLLEEKSSSVTEICFRVGFKELAHFSKNFKQLVGVSPDNFRKSLCSI